MNTLRKNIIHQTPEERQSYALEDANNKLATIQEKLTNMESKDVQKMKIEGISLMTIKGDKGDRGERGERGSDGRPGRDGMIGKNGKDGINGIRGRDGKDGKTGLPGRDGIGINGKDGSPDEPDTIIDKIHTSEKQIDPKKVKGLFSTMKSFEDWGKNPQGMYASGGANQLTYRDSNNTVISQTVLGITFGSTLSPTYSQGIITLDAATTNTTTISDVATLTALPSTGAIIYANGTAGVGATLTRNGNGALGSIDGIAVVVGDRILVKDQANTFENGIYIVSGLGSGTTPYILTRTTDSDQASEVDPQIVIPTRGSTTNKGKQWSQTTSPFTTFGTDPLVYSVITPSASPATPTYSVQYNNAGVFGGSSVFTFNPSTARVNLANTSLGAAFPLEIQRLSSAGTVLSGATHYTNTNVPPGYLGRRARGTSSVPLAVQNGDYLGSFGGTGYGTSISAVAQAAVQMFANQTWTASAQGTYLTLAVTPNASTTLTEAIRVLSTGNLQFPDNATSSTRQISVAAQTASTTAGNPLYLISGNGNGAAGGDLLLQSGSGTVGGQVYIIAGSSTNGNGNDVWLQAANATTAGNGGDVEFFAGAKAGAGTNGNFNFWPKNGVNSGELDFDSITASRIFTYPDGTGTIFLASGLTGGQTATGGTAASENLTLASTSNGTKGYILAQDRLGINQTTPSAWLDIKGSVTLAAAQFKDASGNLYFNCDPVSGFVYLGDGQANINGTALYTTVTTQVIRNGSNRFEESQGTTLAAANNLTLSADGNAFLITGNTQINLILSTNWQNGSTVTLLFSSTPTVKHNQAASGSNLPIKLAGSVDFTAALDSRLTLKLLSNGVASFWYETARTVA